MYKVLVVEDMDLTRQDIIQLIEWEKYGFELLPDARNGKIGLEYARRYEPDIIITDIKMPVMTGLDMVEELKRQGCKATVILLTAYEEFELAIRALQMGVQTFVLKYEIDEESLLRELNKCVEVLKNQKNIEYMKKRQELLKWLKGNRDVAFDKECPFGWSGKTDLILYKKLYTEKNVETSEANLQELLEQHIQEENFMVLGIDERSYVVFRKDKTYLSEVHRKEAVRGFASNVLEVFETIFGAPWAVAVVGKIQKLSDLSVCYHEAELILQNHVFFVGNCILDKREQEKEENVAGEIEDRLRNIEHGVENEEYQKILGYLAEIQTILIRNKNLTLYRKTVDRLMFLMVRKSIHTESRKLEEAIGELKNRQKDMNLFDFMKSYKDLLQNLQDRHENKYSSKIRYMKAYVREHYAQKISLNDLAEELGMNAIYLSQLFKREMGIAFSQYVTRVRIENAMELLKQGKYKVYEVSELVGYQTVQYFSKVFKKETGKNPKDFEKRGE